MGAEIQTGSEHRHMSWLEYTGLLLPVWVRWGWQGSLSLLENAACPHPTPCILQSCQPVMGSHFPAWTLLLPGSWEGGRDLSLALPLT